MSMIRRLYDKTLQEANTPKARWLMYAISFAESSFFPLPPDLLMIPMILANRAQAWRLAFYATIFSVLGGIVGYGIGVLFIHLGDWIIQSYHLQDGLARFQQQFQEWGFWIIALKGLTPIPFKLVTIASGMAHFNFPLFIGASIIARSFRFYLLAWLLWQFGPLARHWIEKYLTLALTLILGSLILGFALLKLL